LSPYKKELHLFKLNFGVVVLHETIHELHKNKLDGVIFKIDFEKASYDKVKWPFLQQVLRMKCFDQGWCDRIKYYVEPGSMGIRVNDHIGHNFQTSNGLRQGDPLSPILFNIVADMLAIFIACAKEGGGASGEPDSSFGRWWSFYTSVC
jgi:hypothetical protein